MIFIDIILHIFMFFFLVIDSEEEMKTLDADVLSNMYSSKVCHLFLIKFSFCLVKAVKQMILQEQNNIIILG